MEAAGFDHPRLAGAAPFDLVFANILKGPLIELAPAMAAHIARGGLAILSGLLVVQAEAVLAAAHAPSPDLDWSTLALEEPAALTTGSQFAVSNAA